GGERAGARAGRAGHAAGAVLPRAGRGGRARRRRDRGAGRSRPRAAVAPPARGGAGGAGRPARERLLPSERLDEMMTIYDEEFRRRGLDGAVWGHISDGNLHPNVIPRSMAAVVSGRDAILAFGGEAL